MKKNLLTNFTYVVIGLVFAIGLSYIHAATFVVPSTTAPAGNTPTPINVGPADQVKPIGSCTTTDCGGLALLGGFLANQNAAFNAQVIINGLLLGGTPGKDGTLAFGNKTTPTSITASGTMDTTQAMQSGTLVNTNGNNGLCANAAGQVVLCNIDICSNISGLQLTVPSGDVANSDGTCSPAPKRFWAVMAYNYGNGNNSDGGVFMGGAVVNGSEVWHTPFITSGGVTAAPGDIPFVDQVGIYDGNGSSDWLINQIPGIQQTDFVDGGGRLLNVVEAGTYDIKISSSGTIGIKGKFDGDTNAVGVDFYLQVNDQEIPLDNAQYIPYFGGGPTPPPYTHEPYPVSTDHIVDFGAIYQNGTTWGGTGNGNQWTNGSYNFAFDKTYNLKPGDIVALHANVYGGSRRDGFLGIGDGSNNFFYNITSNNTVFDITETPSGN